jgi:cell wall-associated NlpC family hydrolase
VPPTLALPLRRPDRTRASIRRRGVAQAGRAAIVATTTAAAALAVLLPTEPAAAPAAPVVTTQASALPAGSAPAQVRAVDLAAAATPVAPTRAPSAAALDRAMSKLGAPYRYGAAGPSAFDCSGLVTWAFQDTGVSLPRSSRAMSQVGTPVARGDLRPGDLVFFYQPVSHVAIYIGDGKVVHASSKRSPVKISDLAAMTFTSARRV